MTALETLNNQNVETRYKMHQETGVTLMELKAYREGKPTKEVELRINSWLRSNGGFNVQRKSPQRPKVPAPPPPPRPV